MSCGNCTNCNNRCPICLSCNTDCDTQQTFCTGSTMQGQAASAYIGAANAPSIQRNDIIIDKLPRTKFNELLTFINRAAHYGNTPSNIGLNIEAETREFIYADKIKEILNGLTSISSSNNIVLPHPVAKDEVIYAEDFQLIMQAINNLKLSSSACNICISDCDVGCDSCETCNSCVSCNSCQGVSSYSSHYSSCDTPPAE